MNKITIKSKPGDNAVDVYLDGKKINPADSQAVMNHSPDGFNIGYGGSGPAQTALGILLAHTGNRRMSVRMHQDFKWEFVSVWKKKDADYEVDIDAFVVRKMNYANHTGKG